MDCVAAMQIVSTRLEGLTVSARKASMRMKTCANVCDAALNETIKITNYKFFLAADEPCTPDSCSTNEDCASTDYGSVICQCDEGFQKNSTSGLCEGFEKVFQPLGWSLII